MAAKQEDLSDRSHESTLARSRRNWMDICKPETFGPALDAYSHHPQKIGETWVRRS
jgi:hypothetical protein